MGPKRTRAVALTATVLLAIGGVARVDVPSAQGPDIGQVRAIGGNLTVVHPDGMLMVVSPPTAREGSAARGVLALVENDVVRTGDGRAVIELKGDITLAVRENTSLKLVSRWERDRGNTRLVRLDRGEIWVSVRSGSQAVEVETPTVAVIPTNADVDIKVDVNAETIVTVLRQAAELITMFGPCHLRAPMQSRVARDSVCTPAVTADPASAVAWARDLGVTSPAAPVVTPPPPPIPAPVRPPLAAPPVPPPTASAPPAVATPPGPPTPPSGLGAMVTVPAGEFWMGSTREEVDQVMATCVRLGRDRVTCREDSEREFRRRRVHVDTFQIDRYEVTNQAYQRFITASKRPGPSITDQALLGALQPVVGVTWHDADAYCRSVGKRLPTEAEWEKAARGPDGLRYPWGNDWDPTKANAMEQRKVTAPVGSYPNGVSPYGVHDLAGNVWEWVADTYANYTDLPASPRNPRVLEGWGGKIVRGGSFNDPGFMVRSTMRQVYKPEDQDSNVGFRCAKAGG